MNDTMSAVEPVMSAPITNGTNGHMDVESEAMDVPLRPEEKRRLNWENGLYLAPLTTVGNLVSLHPVFSPPAEADCISSLSGDYASHMAQPSHAQKWHSLNP